MVSGNHESNLDRPRWGLTNPRSLTPWTPPPGSFAVCFLLWGWFTGNWIAAVVMALLLEAPNLTRSRLDLAPRDFVVWWNVSMLVILGFLVINLIRSGADATFRQALLWGPVLLSPLAIVQRFAGGDPVPLNTIFVLIRRKRSADRKAGREVSAPMLVDFGVPLLAVVIMSCGAGWRQGNLFPVISVVLVALGLWWNADRPALQRRSWWKLLLCLGVAGMSGVAAVHAVTAVNVVLQRLVFTGPNLRAAPDERWSHTRIGQLGHIKLSRRVDWLMRSEEGPSPFYLREVTYNVYSTARWMNSDTEASIFYPVKKTNRIWQVGEAENLGGEGLLGEAEKPAMGRIELRGRPSEEEQVLPMPYGVTRLTGNPASELRTNEFRTVQGVGIGDVSQYRASFVRQEIFDPPPVANDVDLATISTNDFAQIGRLIWGNETSDVARVNAIRLFLSPGSTYTPYTEEDAEMLSGSSLYPPLSEDLEWGICGNATGVVERANAIQSFLHRGFTYSTFTGDDDLTVSTDSPLLSFLINRRSGHCEYFATVAVLLCRVAGIPARYAVGYGVSEWDDRNGVFVLRGRDRHAWAQVWLDDRWEILETTPSEWHETDAASLGWMGDLGDWFHAKLLRFQLWQDSEAGQRVLSRIGWVGIPLVLFYVLVRMLRGKRRKMLVETSVYAPHRLGLDSEWFAVEAALTERAEQAEREGDGVPLEPLETLTSALAEGRALHQRLRFDPAGLAAAERERLRALGQRCLEVVRGERVSG